MTVRINRAEVLLQEGMGISETCFTVGFDSTSSFTGLFKRYTHLTPSAYQQAQQQRKEQIKKTPLQFVPNCFAEQKGWL